MTASPRTRTFQFEAPWQWFPPIGETRSLLLGLHGMAQDGSRLLQKREFLRQQGVGLILPSGPYPMEVRGRSGVRQGHAWYIFTGDQPAFRASMEKSESDLLGLIQIVREEIRNPDVPLDLLGFSQGGYLAGFLHLAGHRKHRLVCVPPPAGPAARPQIQHLGQASHFRLCLERANGHGLSPFCYPTR